MVILFTLIKGANIYAPQNIGKMNILIASGKIAYIGSEYKAFTGIQGIEIYEAEGLIAFPGIIDGHVHISGGGGEGGFATRTVETGIDDFAANGTTTVVGILGTDCVCRSLEILYAKAKMLETQGITTFMYTGSYRVPAVTLTGDVQKDLILIDKVVGVGEIAISDHRSSQPSKKELSRLCADARVGGMLSGKAGIVHFHVGDHIDGLKPIMQVFRETSLPITQFYPTHVNRNAALFKQAMDFVKMGGYIDLTAGIEPQNPADDCIPAYKALKILLDSGADDNNITITSDGNGSASSLDSNGEIKKVNPISCGVLLNDLKKAVTELKVPLEKALKTVTANPARILKLESKGNIKEGMDGDIVISDEKLNINTVFAKGKKIYQQSQVP